MKRRTNSNNNSVAHLRRRTTGSHLNMRAPAAPLAANGHATLLGEPQPAGNGLIAAKDIQSLTEHWQSDPRWHGVSRSYTAEKVLRLRGTMKIEHTIADKMSRKLWRLLNTDPFIPALGALTGNQAVQMAQAGLKAIYLSGWQVAADANLAAMMYPDQSLYPSIGN